MKIKGIIDEDFVNYKKPSMVLQFPNCSFKCEKECGQQVCQNSALATAPDIEVSIDSIVERYLKNSITRAIVCAGLEPLDSLEDLLLLINKLRIKSCKDEIVIYTGYTEQEAAAFEKVFNMYGNIIVKYGRYVPGQTPHLDTLLGVKLASDNQYAKGYNLNEDRVKSRQRIRK